MAFLTEAANRGSISTGYDIEHSLKLEERNDESMDRVVSSEGNKKIWCASFWFKRSELDGSNQFWQIISSQTTDGSGGYSGWPTRIGFWYSTDGLWVDSRHGTGNARLTSLVFQRDTSAWYHFVVMQDTTQSTDTDRTKIYINGTLLLPADLDYDQYPAQNADTAMHVNASKIRIGGQPSTTIYNMSGYIADVHILDGQAGKTASDFGEYDDDSGIWKPKAYTGAYGTNGFHLKFEDGSNMGLDSSGNGNNLTSNNITAADQATDTPTNNFATINPLFKYPSSQVITEGATLVTRTSGSGLNKTFYTTQGVTSGKWYIEAQLSGSHGMIGATTMTSMSSIAPDGTYTGTQSTDIGYYSYNGQYYIGASGTTWGAGNWHTTSYIVQIAIDMDNRKIYFGNNNTYQASGDPSGNSNGITLPDTSDGYMLAFSYDDGGVWKLNTGGYTTMSISSAESDANGYGTFEYAPPSGYYALCSKNLAEYG